jgi:DNA repair protein RecN (Recombination protein N)
MLYSLRVKNLAIIEKIEVDFSNGLNVITGETGAGKSIFLNSLLLLSGEKLNSKELIRHGEEKSEVEAIFFFNDNETVVKRVISNSGKSKAYLNDSFTSLHNLSKFLKNYIEFAAQNQNQSIFNTTNQLKLLDAFGSLEPVVNEYRNIYNEFLDV